MSVLDLARRYLAAGISVIPIALDGTKAPWAQLLPKVYDPDKGQHRATWKPFQQRLATELGLFRAAWN